MSLRRVALGMAVTVSAALAGAAAALPATMHPELGARLAGMGEHGVVNLQVKSKSGQVCWTFDLTTKGITRVDPHRAERPSSRHSARRTRRRVAPRRPP